MVIFEPILAAKGVTYAQRITLDHKGLNVIVNLGWDNNLTVDLEPLVTALRTVDLVLLTHATIKHLGAFSLLYKRVPELQKVPIYCTYPVMTLGKLVTIDAYQCRGLAGPFVSPDLSVADIEHSFNNVNLIKYSQPINLAGQNLDGLYITGYNSGHTLGGTMWKVETPQDSILVALDWNHSKDTHLNGGFLAAGGKVNEQLLKPQVLLTSANVAQGSLKKNRTEFTENVAHTLQSGGSVLVPTSLSRALELILILDSMKLKVPVLFLSTVSQRLMSQASTMLEWMITSIINDWQVKNESPFETSNVKCLSSYEELANYRDDSKVILCTDQSLELGYARRVFVDIASSSKNSLILTQTRPPNSLSAALYELWNKKGLSSINGDLPLKITEERPLSGAELKKYNAKIENEQKQTGARAALEKRNQAILTQEEESSSDEEDTMHIEYTEGGEIKGPQAFVYGEVFDYTVQPDDGICQFPFTVSRQKTDDYGELLKPGQFEKVDGEIDIEMDTGEKEDAAPIELSATDLVVEKPLKLVTKEEIVKMNCLINFLDLNGLTDTRSLSMILTQLKPQNIIAVPGNAIKTVESVNPHTLVADIKIEVATENRILNLKLSKEFQDGLKWQQILGDIRVTHATGRIEPDPQQEGGRLLEKVPSTSTTAGTLYVGEIKLTELKKKLSQEGYRAEFQGPGVLVCNDKVAVRKQGESNFVIEGGLNEEFYVVRQAIKSFLAQI